MGLVDSGLIIEEEEGTSFQNSLAVIDRLTSRDQAGLEHTKIHLPLLSQC